MSIDIYIFVSIYIYIFVFIDVYICSVYRYLYQTVVFRNIFRQSLLLFPNCFDLLIAHIDFEEHIDRKGAKKAAKVLLKVRATS